MPLYLSSTGLESTFGEALQRPFDSLSLFQKGICLVVFFSLHENECKSYHGGGVVWVRFEGFLKEFLSTNLASEKRVSFVSSLPSGTLVTIEWGNGLKVVNHLRVLTCCPSLSLLET